MKDTQLASQWRCLSIREQKFSGGLRSDSAIEPVQDEVQGLLEKMRNKQGTGALQKISNPIFDAKGKFVENNKTQHPIEVVASLYNYKFVLEDKSRGVHNTKYVVQLLMDSLKSLDKNYDDSGRPK